MATVIKPQPLPDDWQTYVPAQGTPYKVSNGDDWWKLADRPEVRNTGMTANDLCYFNFRTRKPPEINWYLHNKVGCQQKTRDGHNYMFSTADQPGVVYLPMAGPPPPLDLVTPKKPTEQSNAWFGVGGKGGTMFVVVGIETVGGYVVSLDDPTKGMAVTASINRLGLGFGVSGGFCIIFITGVKSPSQLNGYQEGDVDFTLAAGPKWAGLVKDATIVKKLKPLIDVLKKSGVKTPGALKKALKAREVIADLIGAGKSVVGALGIGPTAEPHVIMIDIPIGGGGAEAAVFFGVANFNAVWDNSD